ncbi:MAG TPA: DUF1800 domain-containing protein [Bacteroidia bacterium]|nr:DUF1800 domain-containing protein [Bacteroidia bacterium]HNU32114.1 DUF1800 domain-containing protein [Bacteroidia bacterium]
MQLSQKQIQHLFLRAGFGFFPNESAKYISKSKEQIIESVFQESKNIRPIAYLPYPLSGKEEKEGVGGFQILKMILKSKKDTEELNLQWIFKMTWTQAQLREKMTYFWHNHFATNTPFAYLMQEQNNLLRTHALGNFKGMLLAVAKDPAMLIYLNNQQNKKAHPNENFARELLELFTLGEGNYTETDVKEAARAFTGWATNTKGQYVFNEHHHDNGIKKFMGEEGNFNGEDIIAIVLKNKQCAKFITKKIYSEFVNPAVDVERVEKLGDNFFKSGYDIERLMRDIFLSNWFYDEENIGCKIASPVELIVRLKKLIKLEFNEDKTALEVQKVLGQVLFFPPNVAGWKGGENWIDSASLLIRLSIPQYVINETSIMMQGKPPFEEEDKGNQKKYRGKVRADWKEIVHNNTFKNNSQLFDELVLQLIQCSPTKINKAVIEENNAQTDSVKKIISVAANIMSTPEFQLI